MSCFSKYKKAFIAGITGILAVILILCIFILAQKRYCGSENTGAVQSQNTEANVKTDGDTGEKQTAETKDTDKTGGEKKAESPLKEGENLEKMVDDFNTLPDGEEKEKVRKRLEEILAEAEKQAPSSTAGN